MAQGVAVVASSISMLEEVGASKDQIDELSELKTKMNQTNANIDKIDNLDRNTKTVLKGPNIDPTRRLSDNIRYTTNFVRRSKDILTAVGVLSPAAATAVNTNQTNASLNEMLLNQQNQMIMLQRQDEEKRAERVDQEAFFAAERKKRQAAK
jgi:predicted transcriptional regulator